MASGSAARADAAAPREGRGGLDPLSDANRIKFSWLVKLHWAAILGQALAIAAVSVLNIIHLHLDLLGLLLGVELAVNVGQQIWLRRVPVVRESAIAWAMLFDTLMLTVILAVTGNYSNPFSTLYLVNVALAALLLRPRWAWAMLVVSLALFGSLFGLDHLNRHGFELSDYDHMELMGLHMQGMWVAFAIAAAFIVYIVVRVTTELHARERELAAARSLAARQDKVSSLATLAAGAAHEISTPLATIAVVTRELERALGKGQAPPGAQEDLALIRQQLGRCQDILQQMSAHAGENAGETFVVLSLRQWAEAALAGLPDRTRVAVVGGDLDGHRVEGPARGLARALRSLLKNAVQASPPGVPVELRLSAADGEVRAEVADRGAGMPSEIRDRAGEPFFTTKGPGEGMGLGLFLARTLVEQLGGHLELDSVPASGTTARLRLPAALPFKQGGHA